jgi:acyl dehydratase
VPVEVGQELAPWTLEDVTPDRLKVLALILRDPNPIHWDREAVARLGLGDRPVNQGPANMGYLLNLLGSAFPGSRVTQLRVRFVGQVLAGDRVVAGGRVTSQEVDGGDEMLGCSVWLDVHGRGRAVEGTATVRRARS